MKQVALVTAFFILSATIFFLFYFEEDSNVIPYVDSKERSTLLINSTVIKIEVVDTYNARQLGLSGRPLLLQNQGMLFIFSEDDFHGIWMKDMLFPIDILWINNERTVVDIETNVVPESFPNVFKPFERSRYVLEVNSGFVEKHQIKIGDIIQF